MELNRREFLKGSFFATLAGIFGKLDFQRLIDERETGQTQEKNLSPTRIRQVEDVVSQAVVSIDGVECPGCMAEVVVVVRFDGAQAELWSDTDYVPNGINLDLGSVHDIEISFPTYIVRASSCELNERALSLSGPGYALGFYTIAPWWSPQRDADLEQFAKDSNHISGATNMLTLPELLVDTELAP